MKTPAVFLVLFATSVLAGAQAAASAPTGCSKNISFAVAEGGQPVPAIPKFVEKWIDKKAHQEDYKNLCFSQIPSSIATNYLVIFSTSEAMFNGLTPSAHTYTSSGSKDATTKVSSYGGTWSYSYVGMPPPSTTTTLDLRRDDKPRSIFVRAYNQQGKVLATYSLSGFFSKEKIMEYVLANILGDTTVAPKQRSVATPLSVYYVNCDVDSPSVDTAKDSLSDSVAPAATTTAAASPATAPAHNDPAAQATLNIWSVPPGADISLDGAYVGKTPYSASVPLGEHTITLHKQDFGTWQRQMQVMAGDHKVGTYLEQKSLTLDFGSTK